MRKNSKKTKRPGMSNLADVTKLTEKKARQLLEKILWPEGPSCPQCNSRNVSRLKGGRPGLFRCKECPNRRQFTVTVGTIFESSHIPLRKWILAFHLMCSSKKGISSLQLSRNLGITYKSAWHLAHRIRYAMRREAFTRLLKGVVEVDETYVGGKSHGPPGRGAYGKTPVVALVERHGRAISGPVNNVSAQQLKGAIRLNVDKSSTIMTDDWPSYRGIGSEYKGGHYVVQHGKREYVRGNAHTNTVESYFALVKRSMMGTFHHVSRKHLARYCDEISFRWNHRNVTDEERTIAALQLAPGARLYYKVST